MTDRQANRRYYHTLSSWRLENSVDLTMTSDKMQTLPSVSRKRARNLKKQAKRRAASQLSSLIDGEDRTTASHTFIDVETYLLSQPITHLLPEHDGRPRLTRPEPKNDRSATSLTILV